MLTQKDVLDEFDRVGAILKDGHFRLSDDLHSTHYVNKDAVFARTMLTDRFCAELAARYAGKGIGVVAGPAIGGALMAQRIAWYLSFWAKDGNEVLAAYADKTPEKTFVLRRGYDGLVAGKEVLIAEDVITTGGSARKVMDAVMACGGRPVGVAALCYRGGVHGMDDLRWFQVLANLDFPAWKPDTCPLCRQGVPLNTDLGKGPLPAP